MSRRSYAGAAAPTTLASPITTTSTTATLTTAVGYPDGSLGPFALVLDRGTATEEKVLVASRSGTSLTFAQRGYDGTLAQNHSAGATVEHISTAIDHDEANEHVNATTGIHGLPTGDGPVGKDAAQTLRNKAIESSTGDFTTLRRGGVDVVDLSATQTLVNKTLANPTLSGTTQAGTVNADAVNAGGKAVATKDGSETLTNKTLTNPTLNNPTVNGGTIDAATLKRGGVEVADLSTAQTLVGKTLTAPKFDDGGGVQVADIGTDGVGNLKVAYCSAYNAVLFYLGQSTWQEVPMNGYQEGTNWMAFPSWGVKVPKAGVYQLTGQVTFLGGNNGEQRQVQWALNHTRTGPSNGEASRGTTTVSLPLWTRALAANDVVSAFAFQNETFGTVQVAADPTTYVSWITVRYLGLSL